MEPKIIDFDFASLYPTMMKDFIKDKTRFRRQKIERLIERINDKRTNQELPSR